MRVYIRDGMWQVAFLQEGVLKRLSCGLEATKATREDAERAGALRMRRSYAASGTMAGEAPCPSESLSEALERAYQNRWSRQKSRRSARQRIDIIQAGCGFWMIKDISYSKLLDLQQGWLKEGFAPATVNRRMGLIKTAIMEARRVNPAVPTIEFPSLLKEDNQKDRYLSDEEEARVLSWLDKQIAHDEIEGKLNWSQVKDAFIILVDTGMRLGELLEVQEKGTFDGKKIILRTGQTKSGKGRVVPLTERALSATSRWWNSPKRTGNWADHRWALVRKNCGIEDVNLHILRHTCASRLLQKGVNLYVVSKWLGHSSIKVTERYAHLIPDVFDDALSKLEA